MAGGSRQEQQGGSWGKALQPLGKTGFLPFRGCSISHSRMNSQANWEAGNQAGAWGKRCGLPQQLCKPTPPETTTLRKFRKSPSGSWMAASYPAYGIAGIEKPNQAQLYAWGLSKGHQNSWDVSTQQSQAAKAPIGQTPHSHQDGFFPQVFPSEDCTRLFQSSTHTVCNAASLFSAQPSEAQQTIKT